MGTFLFKMMVVDDNVVNLGANIMMIVAVLIIPQTQAQILTGVLRGAGDNRFIAKYSLLSVQFSDQFWHMCLPL